MSQQNLEAIRVLYEHLNRTGEPYREGYALDATFDASRLPGFGFYRGFEEFFAAWREYRDTFDEWWIEVEQLLDGRGDSVFVAVRDGGRMKMSDGEVRQRLFHVHMLRAAKVIAWTVFLDRSEALEAAGLPD